MYASKLLTERSPVAKCVMIAEADTDAAERIAEKVKEGDAAGRRHIPASVKHLPALVRDDSRPRGESDVLPVETAVQRVNRLLKGWGGFYSVGYPSRVFRKVNHYVVKRMARFLNRKSQRRYRLKFADSYYGEMAHYGLYRLATARTRI